MARWGREGLETSELIRTRLDHRAWDAKLANAPESEQRTLERESSRMLLKHFMRFHLPYVYISLPLFLPISRSLTIGRQVLFAFSHFSFSYLFTKLIFLMLFMKSGKILRVLNFKRFFIKNNYCF